MFTSDEIKHWSTTIHANIRAKGFWDKYRSPMLLMGLIASEQFEAFEAIRGNKWPKYFPLEDAGALLKMLTYDNYAHILEDTKKQFAAHYEAHIKDTVPAEIAGTCIRCFDAIGGWLHIGGGQIHDAGLTDAVLVADEVYALAAFKLDEGTLGAHRCEGFTEQEERDMFTEYLLGMVPAALGVQTGGPKLGYLTPLAAVIDTLKNMCLLSIWFGIDLKTHIELEVAYNTTRAQKHGKSF